ncbi:hypothetical protein D3C75_759190 [compost metagenome]
MKATTTHDVKIWWGAEIPAGTELDVEMGERLYHINKPEIYNDCYIGSEVLKFEEGSDKA